MNQNIFEKYIQGRDTTSFLMYAKSFIDWTIDTNLFPANLSSFCYVFAEDEFELLGAAQLRNHLKKNSYFYLDIENEGLKSILFKRYKHLLDKESIEDIEQYFWWGFIETIYQQCNCYLGNKKQSPIIEIKNNFNTFLTKRITNRGKRDLFLDGFEYFLEKIPKFNNTKDCKFGYVWVENVGFGQKDIGVVLFNKTFLSSEILFYQIIDKD